MNRKVLFAPSLLGADLLNVALSIDALRGEHDWIHLDIMDGHFVNNLSFGPAMAASLRKKYPDAFLDVHLMLDKLDFFLPLFAEAGASLISIHAEVEPQLLRGRLEAIRKMGISAGIVLAPATPPEQIRYVLDIVDLVLVMSVTPGFGGQSLIPGTLEKVRDLLRWREVEHYRYLIQVDGGIHNENIRSVVSAGCDVVVMGSALFGSSDPALYLQNSKHIVRDILR